jgi:outer membrane protein assembly factor BamB
LAATGEISTPMAVQLRNGSGPDFVGVNSEGTVYALAGTDGIALWTARYKRGRSREGRFTVPQKQFVPVLIPSTPARMIVAFDKGVRALEGTTGRELWSTELPGRALMGLAVISEGRADPEVYLIDEKLDQMFMLNGGTGKIEAQIRLKDQAVATPLYFASKDFRALLIPVRGGSIELRKAEGEYLRSIDIGAEITTAPVLVETSRGTWLWVGTRKGLIAFDTDDFQKVALIALDGDYPIGSLSIAASESYKATDLVMTTNDGRIVAADITTLKVRWSAEGSSNATAAAFADLDDDGRLDVIIPGKNAFAIALSGLDGSLIWQSDAKESNEDKTKTESLPRSLSTARVSDGRLLVVGTDPALAGLRAQEVRRTTAMMNVR